MATLGLPYMAGDGQEQMLQMDFEDLENDKTFSLFSKAQPGGLDVVGWYTTSPQLNSYTQLIHDRFAAKVDATANIKSASAFSDPRQPKAKAVHLTLDPASLECNAFVRAPCGLEGSQNGLFSPIRTNVVMADAEKSSGKSQHSMRLARAHALMLLWPLSCLLCLLLLQCKRFKLSDRRQSHPSRRTPSNCKTSPPCSTASSSTSTAS